MEILYEDSHVIGFYKPAGLATSLGEQEDSLLARVKVAYPELFDFSGFWPEEAGLLYRLDHETEGLVLFAKNRAAFERFQNDSTLEKIYRAKVMHWDELPDAGVIDLPLAHKSSKRMIALIPGKRVQYQGQAKDATTRFEKEDESAWVRCFIRKGMRHQIRVHLAAMGHPIVGDKLYHPNPGTERLQLQCVGIRSQWLNLDLSLPHEPSS